MDKSILKKFDQAIKVNEGLKPILSFYKDVLKEQLKVVDKSKEITEIPSEKEAAQLLLEGKPLSRRWPAPVDAEQMKALFVKLGEVLVKHRPEQKEKIAAITAVDWDFAQLVGDFAQDNMAPVLDKAKEEGIDESLFAFLFINALRPFYVVYADKVKHLAKPEEWTKPHCPVCGQRGEIAELEGEGGKRHLYCSLCDITWKYRRLECLYCGAGHEDLRYLEIEDSLYRLDVCDKCKGYIKTIDATELATSPNLFLEDLLTIHLDLLAQKEGFTKDPVLTRQ